MSNENLICLEDLRRGFDPISGAIGKLQLEAVQAHLKQARYSREDCNPEGENCGECPRCDFKGAMGIIQSIADYQLWWDFRARHPNEVLVPFHDGVQAAWKQHLHDAAAYAADCQNVFGRILSYDMPLKGTEEHRQAAERTREIFLATYRQPRNPFNPEQQSHDPWPPKRFTFGL